MSFQRMSFCALQNLQALTGTEPEIFYRIYFIVYILPYTETLLHSQENVDEKRAPRLTARAPHALSICQLRASLREDFRQSDREWKKVSQISFPELLSNRSLL